MEKEIKFTFKQEQILSLAALGLKDQSIAESIGISVRTVQNHLAKIYTKTKTKSRIEAVMVYLNADFEIAKRKALQRKKRYYKCKKRIAKEF